VATGHLFMLTAAYVVDLKLNRFQIFYPSACVHGESPDSCDNFFDIDDLCDNFFNIDGYLTPLKPQPEFKGNVVGWFAA
jgi:hypothetical protein